eukprot:4966222-Ditylum_brightwellii.AAC.1
MQCLPCKGDKKDNYKRHIHGRCFFGWAEEPLHTSHPAHVPHRSQQHENQTNSAAGPRAPPSVSNLFNMKICSNPDDQEQAMFEQHLCKDSRKT